MSRRIPRRIALAPSWTVTAGTAPITFADFGIEPPSVAGVVTVEDHWVLEFKIRLLPG